MNAFHSVAGSTAVGPVVDLLANRDFKGTPIVPKYMQDLQNFEQYNEKTTRPAYWLGQIFNWSPMEVDHAISGCFGIIGQLNRALLPMDGEQRDFSVGFKNKYVADSNYSTDLLNKAYDTRDKLRTECTRKPTGENAINYEKYSMIVDYISNINKTVGELDSKEKRLARNQLLSKIKNWNITYTENDKSIISAYSAAISDDYLVTSLPKSKLEETRNKSQYMYTMTPDEYSAYIDEYLTELERLRKKALRSSSKSPAVLGEKLKEAKSDAASSIKDKYKIKFRKKFEKAE